MVVSKMLRLALVHKEVRCFPGTMQVELVLQLALLLEKEEAIESVLTVRKCDSEEARGH